MQTSSEYRKNKKQLDIIYEDPYAQNTGLDPKQKEILNKYYIDVSRRHLRPSARRMHTPAMTPDNDIKFVDNGSLIKNPKPTKTPPPPLWGEESEIDETAGEPFYDMQSDPARNSKTLLHLDSSRSKRKQFLKSKLQEHGIEDDQAETIIIQDKRPEGSKLKRKIVYVYDSSDSEDEIKAPQKPPKPPQSIRSLYSDAYPGAKQSGRNDIGVSSRQYAMHNRSAYNIPSGSSYGTHKNGLIDNAKRSSSYLNRSVHANPSQYYTKFEPLSSKQKISKGSNYANKNPDMAPRLLAKPQASSSYKLPSLNSRRIRTSALQRMKA